jgi:hypothetical protein
VIRVDKSRMLWKSEFFECGDPDVDGATAV